MQKLLCSQTAVVDNKLGITTPPPPPTTTAPATTAAPAATGTPAPFVPPTFIPIPYTHLWVSSDGNTHIASCTLSNLTLSSYIGGVGGLASESYNDIVVNASVALIVQLPAGQYNPPHTAPVSQFVTTMQGSWCSAAPNSHCFAIGHVLTDDVTMTANAVCAGTWRLLMAL